MAGREIVRKIVLEAEDKASAVSKVARDSVNGALASMQEHATGAKLAVAGTAMALAALAGAGPSTAAAFGRIGAGAVSAADHLGQFTRQAKDALKAAGDFAAQAGDDLGNAAADVWEKHSGKIMAAVVAGGAYWALTHQQEAAEAWDWGKQKIAEGTDFAKQKLGEIKDAAVETAGYVRDHFSEVAEAVGGRMLSSVESALSGWALSAAKQTADLVVSLGDLRRQTGLSIEDLSALKAMADGAGVAMGEAAKAATMLKDAGEGQSDAAKKSREALEAMGVSLRDGQGTLKSWRDLLVEISGKLATYSDEGDGASRKLALAMATVGSSGKEMMSLLNEGSATLSARLGEAAEQHTVYSQDVVQKTEALYKLLAQRRAEDAADVQRHQQIYLDFAIAMNRASRSSEGLMDRLAADWRAADERNMAELQYYWGKIKGFFAGKESPVVAALNGEAPGGLPQQTQPAPDVRDKPGATSGERAPRVHAERRELAAQRLLRETEYGRDSLATQLSGNQFGDKILGAQREAEDHVARIAEMWMQIHDQQADLTARGYPEEAAKLNDVYAILSKTRDVESERIKLKAEQLMRERDLAEQTAQAEHAGSMASLTGKGGDAAARLAADAKLAKISLEQALDPAAVTRAEEIHAASLAKIVRDHEEAARQINQQWAQSYGTRKEMYAAETAALEEEYRKQRDAAGENAEQILAVERLYASRRAEAKARADDDWAAGAKAGLKDVERSQTSFYDAARKGMVAFDQTAKGVFVNWVTTGKASISDLKTVFLSAMAEMAYQRTIGKALAAGFDYALGLFSPSAPSTAGGSTGAAMQFTRSAKGNVFTGPGVSALSGGVYDSPTTFGFDSHLTAFASGGVLAEAGSPEAVMPLRRTSDGRLGVAAMGAPGGMSVVINAPVTVNASGGTAEQNDDLAKKLSKQMTTDLRALVRDELTQQMRPRGMLYGRG